MSRVPLHLRFGRPHLDPCLDVWLSNIAQSIIHALSDIFRSGVRGIAQWLISIDRAIGIAMQIVARAKSAHAQISISPSHHSAVTETGLSFAEQGIAKYHAGTHRLDAAKPADRGHRRFAAWRWSAFKRSSG
jgi:hypothetical protein